MINHCSNHWPYQPSLTITYHHRNHYWQWASQQFDSLQQSAFWGCHSQGCLKTSARNTEGVTAPLEHKLRENWSKMMTRARQVSSHKGSTSQHGGNVLRGASPRLGHQLWKSWSVLWQPLNMIIYDEHDHPIAIQKECVCIHVWSRM